MFTHGSESSWSGIQAWSVGFANARRSHFMSRWRSIFRTPRPLAAAAVLFVANNARQSNKPLVENAVGSISFLLFRFANGQLFEETAIKDGIHLR
jgi:hypothetical protein